MNKQLPEFTNNELLSELAKRIVTGKLRLETPEYLISQYEKKDYSPAKIIQHVKEKMGLCNREGYALTNIHDIHDEQTNRNPLNLNYFIMEYKEELTNHE